MQNIKTNWAICRKFLAIIALAAVIGFSFAACDNGSGNSGQGSAPSITTPALPNGVVGTAYSQTLAATGNNPITWSLESGALPIGLSLLGNGNISGTPITAGTFTFAVTATKELSINNLTIC